VSGLERSPVENERLRESMQGQNAKGKIVSYLPAQEGELYSQALFTRGHTVSRVRLLRVRVDGCAGCAGVAAAEISVYGRTAFITCCPAYHP